MFTRLSFSRILFVPGLKIRLSQSVFRAVLDRLDRPGSFVTPDGWLEFAFEATRNDTRYPDQPFEAKLHYFLSIYLEESEG